MLAKIIIATGIFMLVAIVFGVAFGGVRVLMKSLFPGKVFDRPEQMDVLQLGLSSKRINSRDFYSKPFLFYIKYLHVTDIPSRRLISRLDST